MSVDTPEPEASADEKRLLLRREALLPNERGRGLGTVAVVCTMAGVASGLALATTLMAMQVADSMAMRPTIHVVTPQVEYVASDEGFLGVRLAHGKSVVDVVLPNTPAERIGLHHGDRIVSIDGLQVSNDQDLVDHIRAMHPGTEVTLVVDHEGASVETMHPVLTFAPLRRY
jgi:S1-C subfamily serine protease